MRKGVLGCTRGECLRCGGAFGRVYVADVGGYGMGICGWQVRPEDSC